MSVNIMNDAEFKQALESNQKIIVKYSADWCGSCKLLTPRFHRLSEDEKYQGIVFVDINSEHNPEARQIANVDNLPFFATFKDGQLVEGGATAREQKVIDMLERLNG